ncbi:MULTISPECIES: cation-translocating P-type ATPase [unclassified Acidovorax]|jgi:Zn2+/Cd2+-exporting ATPase|uniref:heavy metal translocating P-type ATPase n=1 Tax=unclassified Acidovorax TaxID=2684926 RepID=UPI0009E7A0F2|nr:MULTISPECIES: heavy metal translocating P-type ATPase [unclassified Acidovorax]MCT6717997.1 heavy metal translocating P-type ATPase [Acidovorax sp. K2F]RMA63593.1 Cd2+/Zn2+-exporting ATPase [Acidovorax sp. 100]GDY36326.1 heavy metal resistance membrane ATPase [Acidovorax sp. NB1]
MNSKENAYNDHAADACCAADAKASAPAPAPPAGFVSKGTVFRISTMDCAAEESEIRRALEPISGVRGLGFQLGARTLTIDAPEDVIPEAVAAIRKAGFNPEPAAPTQGGADSDDHGNTAEGLWRMVLALALAIAAETLSFFAPDTTVFKGIGMAVAAAAIWLAGFSTYRKGFAALMQGRLNINALMTVAVTGAFLIGQWPEAAMVMALYAIAELIEGRAVDRARNAIKSLLDLTPDTAEVRQPDGSWTMTPAADVQIDTIVRVKPGARIPLDGTVASGTSAVNQAPVTGESIPVDKVQGDPVFAGTINETGTIEITVTAAASNTTLARIIQSVEQAQGSRAPTQQFVDRFAAIYTPAVFIIAVLVAVLTPVFLDFTWMQALYKALVLLVIACPCALVIATPVTVVSGLASAARRGILIKGGVYLEDAHKLKAIALDKTGTITEGKPKLVEKAVLASQQPEAVVLRWAADLAGHSDHPVSKAIAQGLDAGEGGVSGFKALAGRGIEAQLQGQTLVLGNHRLIEERGLCSPAIEELLASHEAKGRTVTLLADEREVLAIFAVADTIKDSSREAIEQLHELGVASVMLTGDNVSTAQAIAKQAGIDKAQGNLLPEDKLSAIEKMQAEHGRTAMTGDGINDAPALARSDIGIAMGAAGTDTAMEAADIVIMNDDLRRIPEVIRLSRRTRNILLQNIVFALGIKALFLVLAVFGSASMWMAVFADMGASLLVVINGLRLLRGVSNKA